jgi:hypothetical protein
MRFWWARDQRLKSLRRRNNYALSVFADTTTPDLWVIPISPLPRSLRERGRG